MPTIPCPQKISCPCENSPFANLSSEAPDLPVFISTVFVNVPPPLGTNWDKKVCQSTCQSPVSQQAADLCAAEQAFLCATSGWTFGGNGPANGPVPPAAATAGRNPVPRFFNAQQTGTAICPDGLPFSITVPPGLFVALSQAGADAEALSYANRQAQLRMICLSNINDIICSGLPYSATIFATGKFLAVAPQSDTWQVIGVLPPGLTFQGNSTGGLAFISGTPTVPGQYSFFVSITDPNGDTMDKLYVFNVCGITNANSLPAATVGLAYNATLTTGGFSSPVFGLSGLIPQGLVLLPNGQITGTPTTTGTNTFAVEITDAVTGLVCFQNVTITVQPGCGAVPTQQFLVTLDSNSTGIAFRPNPGLGLPLLAVCSNQDPGEIETISMIDQSTNSVNAGNGLNLAAGCYAAVNDRFVFVSTGTGDSIVRVTPQPLAATSTSFGSVLAGQTDDVAYNATQKLVYINTENRLVVYDPVANAILGSLAPGTNKFFIGKVSIDEPNNRVYIGYLDQSVNPRKGYVAVVDISNTSLPVLLSLTQFPTVIGQINPIATWNAIYIPDTKIVYVTGFDQAGQTGYISRFNPATLTFSNTQKLDGHNQVGPPIYNPSSKLLFVPCAGFPLTFPDVMVFCVLTDLQIGAISNQGVTQGVFESFTNSVAFVQSNDAFDYK